MFLLGSKAVPTLQLLLPQPTWSSLARALRQRDGHERPPSRGQARGHPERQGLRWGWREGAPLSIRAPAEAGLYR